MIAADRILVRSPNWAGDVIMATPGFRALRASHPDAEIVLHVRPELAPLLIGSPWFDEVLPLQSYHAGAGALLREGLALRPRRFELGVCLTDSWSSALLMRIGGVGRVVGYDRGWRRPLLHLAVPTPQGWIARERHVLGLIEALGCPSRGSHLELFVSLEESSRADALLLRHGIGPGEPFVALAPGASYGTSKMWPPASFAQVADGLAERGLPAVVVGAPAEGPLARQVCEAMRSAGADLTPDLDLGLLKAVLRRARLLVCNDAGARHVAVAFGVPCVVFFGPTSLEKTNLNLERVTALAADVECRPCYLRTCPIDHRCMTRLTPERALAAAERILEGRPPDPGLPVASSGELLG